MKNNCIVLVSLPIMRYAPGLTQLEALKIKKAGLFRYAKERPR
jgi:hypothetical protein